MDLPSVHMHGPEHHAIVPCVLLTAFRNNGEHMDYDAALSEICKRATQAAGPWAAQYSASVAASSPEPIFASSGRVAKDATVCVVSLPSSA